MAESAAPDMDLMGEIVARAGLLMAVEDAEAPVLADLSEGERLALDTGVAIGACACLFVLRDKGLLCLPG